MPLEHNRSYGRTKRLQANADMIQASRTLLPRVAAALKVAVEGLRENAARKDWTYVMSSHRSLEEQEGYSQGAHVVFADLGAEADEVLARVEEILSGKE